MVNILFIYFGFHFLSLFNLFFMNFLLFNSFLVPNPKLELCQFASNLM